MNLRNGSFLKPYNKLTVRTLLGIEFGYRLVSLYLIKHSCALIIQYYKLDILDKNVCLSDKGRMRMLYLAYQIHSSNCSSLSNILKIYINEVCCVGRVEIQIEI